ncbi:uncharacterized protein LOC129769740 [Toxorhynchites rutilus septentrionalis]|uniref:uncharacterized protein LOC129769740 n=1 Tax=Toxorhynchites rutilus septentrionalis TaxID=329112 RepID=UPI00247A1FA7|nr:uncharacterized protein LOC129769740 [Toxorhynchites rutilus septentrionalis]
MDSISAETRSEIAEKLWMRMPRISPGPITSFGIDDFISLVRRYPIIYNRLDKHNKQEYADTWDRLEAILKTPKKFLMMKWKGLRDNFRVELKKEFYSPPDNRYVSKWVHYKKMSFLKEQVLLTLDQRSDSDNNDEVNIMQFVQSVTQEEPTDGERRNSEEHAYANSDIDPREFMAVKEEHEASNDVEFSFNHFHEPEEIVKRSNKLPEVTITPTIATAATNRQQPCILPARVVPSRSCGAAYDDDYHFLMSIHPYLKQLPLPVKLKVRLQMQQFLFSELMKQPIADEED